MALLWQSRKERTYFQKKSKIKKGNPSLTFLKSKNNSAQNVKITIKESFPLSFFRRSIAGSMTVEAAVVLPIFLFFLLNLASYMEIMRLYGNFELALWNAGNKSVVYSAVLDDSGKNSLLSTVYIREKVLNRLGNDYLNNAPLKNGRASVLVVDNPFGDSEDCLDVTLTWEAKALSPFIGFPSFWLTNRYYAHIWNGYDLAESTNAGEVVYLAANGTVYHRNRGCSYLTLSVREVLSVDLDAERNADGGKYDACARCANGTKPATVYVTEEGEKYHYSESCSGLKRTVRAVYLKDVSGSYPACSRCG